MDKEHLYFITLALIILALTGLVAFFVRQMLYRGMTRKKSPEWLQALCAAFYPPSAWLIVGYGLLFSAETLTALADFPISSEILSVTKNLAFIGFSTWIFFSWKKQYEKILLKKISKRATRAEDEVLYMMISRLISIAVFVIVGMIILDIFDVQLTALLAFGGLGGVAVGFASKDVIANFFGGLMLYINRPIAIGERIRSPNKNFEGTVEEIGWYVTRIRTLDRRPTFIPNALFIDAIIENIGRIDNRRINLTVGVRYQDIAKVETIVDQIRAHLKENPEINQSRIQLVHFVNFGDSSLDISVICFTKSKDVTEWRDTQQKLFLYIAKMLHENGADMAYPTQTLYIEQEKES